MTTQFSNEYWQKLAEETRREIDRITDIRNLLNPRDLADRAVECDRKALTAKWVELRNTFIDLGERYRALARKASQQKAPSFTKPRIEKIAARAFSANLKPELAASLALPSERRPASHRA